MPPQTSVFPQLASDVDEEARIKGAPPRPRPVPMALLVTLACAGGVEFSVVLPSVWFYVKELSTASDPPVVKTQLYASLFFTITQCASKLLFGMW